MSAVVQNLREWGEMDHISAEAQAADPELDQALASAIRHLIAHAIDSGVLDSAAQPAD